MSAIETTGGNGSSAIQATSDKKGVDLVRDQVDAFAVLLAEELKRRFESPEMVKLALADMTTGDIMDWCLKIVKSLKQTNIIVPKSFAVNMQQVNNYALEMAESESKRTQLRKEARKQLKYKPS